MLETPQHSEDLEMLMKVFWWGLVIIILISIF